MIRIKNGIRKIIGESDIRNGFQFFLILFPYLLPQYFEDIIDGMPVVAGALNVLSLLFIIVLCLKNINRLLMADISSKIIFILFLANYLIFIISTITNHGRLYPAASHSVQVLLLCVVVFLVSNENEINVTFLKVVRNLTLIYCLLNIIVTLIFPNGISSITTSITAPYFLYGNVNATIRGIFPGICCSMILDKIRGRKVSLPTLLYFGSLIYICFRVYFMATAVVGMIFLLIWSLLENRIKPHIRIFYFLVILTVCFLEITIILQVDNGNVATFITQLFGKSLDFSGRRAIWNRTLYNISNQSILGHGYLSHDELYIFTGNEFGSHNYYLDLMFQRGIIGLIINIAIWTMPLFLIKRKAEISSIIYTMMGLCCVLYVMFLMEPFYSSEFRFMPLLFITLVLLAKLNRPSEHQQREKCFMSSILSRINKSLKYRLFNLLTIVSPTLNSQVAYRDKMVRNPDK